MIDKYTIERVLKAVNIVDVVGDFVKLRKAGVNYTGLCPFHDDRHVGNFIVRPKNVSSYANSWHCFVCDKGGDVVSFLQEHAGLSFQDAIRYLGRKYSIEVDDAKLNYTPPPPRPLPPPLPDLALPRSWVKETVNMARYTVFWTWLHGLPWNDDQRRRLDQTLWLYCLGGWARDGRAVFWLIDHTGVPRSAKLMKYQTDGHRSKEQHATGWIYNQDGYRNVCMPDDHTILKPLFGSHLLKRYPKAKVNIVESEKTALVMANYYGHLDEQLWLAAGGIERLQLGAMQPLIDEGRTVWLWPDRDGIGKWQTVREKLGSDKVKIYTRFFDTCWEPEDGEKADAADIIINMMRDKRTPRIVEETKTEPIWNSDEPFLDEEEMADPQVHEWRLKMSRVHSEDWHESAAGMTATGLTDEQWEKVKILL